MRDSQREEPPESYEDFIDQERESDRSSGDESEEPARDRPQKRVIDLRGGSDPASAGSTGYPEGELAKAIHESGDGGPDSGSAGSPAKSEGELARAIREAGIGGDTGSDPSPPGQEPKSDEELAKAAKELGISFRDDTGDEPSTTPGAEDAMAKAARELGISFRDDPEIADATDPDDPMAAAARELGISFRDEDQSEKKQEKSMLERYWPILLVVVVVATALPIAAGWFLFSNT